MKVGDRCLIKSADLGHVYGTIKEIFTFEEFGNLVFLFPYFEKLSPDFKTKKIVQVRLDTPTVVHSYQWYQKMLPDLSEENYIKCAKISEVYTVEDDLKIFYF